MRCVDGVKDWRWRRMQHLYIWESMAFHRALDNGGAVAGGQPHWLGQA